MKTKSFFLTLASLLVLTAVQAAPLSQTVASINADAKKEGGPAKVVQSISKSTGVPAATIEKQKARIGSYGDVFAAHSISKASGKSFDEIAALKKKGQTWDQIAEASGVTPVGKKGAKTAAQPTPKPSATRPQKTLKQLQHERYQ